MSEFITTTSKQLFELGVLKSLLIGHKGFIAGGCFKNIFNHEQVKDIDVFFRTENDFLDACITVKSWDSIIPLYENKKVKAFKNTNSGLQIELIRTVFGTPEEIISNFDFTITKAAFIDDEFLYHKKFFEHLHTRKLVLDAAIPFPVSTFERTLRYTRYGYGLCRESKEKLLKAIHDYEGTDQLSKSLYEGLD